MKFFFSSNNEKQLKEQKKNKVQIEKSIGFIEILKSKPYKKIGSRPEDYIDQKKIND